tara:strand:+ start:11133 stop:11843 length:711 start_codon:yes stop_codon:yes gene_type:complete
MVKILKILIVLIGVILLSTNNIKQEEVIYAGRFEPAAVEQKYNMLGLPSNRLWMSQSEWKGEQITNKLIKYRFKAWKKIHIEEWVNHMIQEAKKESKVFPDIPYQLYVAQAILESNYGLSKLANDGNNLYGHKYRGQSEGFLVMADDSPTDKFTKFKSQWYSLRSHSYLLMNKYRKRIKAKNPTLQDWYKALCGATNIQGSRRWVSRGNSVYATSCFNGTCYIDKLKSIIKKYKLK